MPKTDNAVGIAFLAIVTILFAGFVVPELFNNFINIEGPQNRRLFQALRIIIMIFIVLVVGGSYHVIVGGSNA